MLSALFYNQQVKFKTSTLEPLQCAGTKLGFTPFPWAVE